MSETPDGNLHLFSYFGQQHQGGRESAVVHRVSPDHGATWSAPRPILDGFRHGLDWRIGATGATATGRLIVTAVRSDLSSRRGAVLGATHSDDGGRTWSAFAPLVQSPPSPFDGGRSQMLPFGQIKTTPSGRLLMMSNLGRFNFLLSSDDDGATWQRSVVVESETPDYSEMAVQPIDEGNWVAVSRIDRAKSSMAQFVTHDAGRSWTLLGGLDMPVRGGYVAPTLNLVEGDEGPVVVLGLTDRTTGRAVLRTVRAADALASARRWSGPRYIAEGLIVRSGYQTGVVDTVCDRMVIADHREVSEFDTALDVSLVPLPEIVPNRLRPRHPSACPTFRTGAPAP
nr:sialidase family protein [Pinisolibacter aquiterrae]